MNPKEYTNLLTRLHAIEKLTEATAPDDLSALINCLKNLLHSELYFLDDGRRYRGDGDELKACLKEPNRLKIGIPYDSQNLKVSPEKSLSNQLIPDENLYATTIPLLKGHLMIEHKEKLSSSDLLLAECAAALLSRKLSFLLNVPTQQKIEQQSRILAALIKLSKEELKATWCILNELEGSKGFLKLNKTVAKHHLKPAVAAKRALQKLSAANLVGCVATGTKGMYIKVLEDRLRKEVEKLYLEGNVDEQT